MNGDEDLCRILKGVTLTSSTNDANIGRYLSNLSFSDILDPCTNIKFPGTLVVSLSRRDLNNIKGFPRQYTKYKPEEIMAWISPLKRQIPSINFNMRAKRDIQLQARQKKIKFDTTTIEFGDEHGLFDCVVPLYIDPITLDFGGDSGLFEIYSQ